MKRAFIIAATALAVVTPAWGSSKAEGAADKAAELTIRLRDGDRIQEYYPVSDQALLIRARDGNKWYQANLPRSCRGLGLALGVRDLKIESARPDGDIGRDSVVRGRNVVCQIESLTESEGPKGSLKG